MFYHFSFPYVTQASGVAISDEVIVHYDLIRVRRQGDEEKERFKLVTMRLSEDQKSIIVDHQNCLRVKDVENTGDIFKTIISKLPPKECRYALYDCSYETKESVKEDLVFIFSYEALVTHTDQSNVVGLCYVWLFGCANNISYINKNGESCHFDELLLE